MSGQIWQAGRVGGHGFALANETPFGNSWLLWALQGLTRHAKITFQVSSQVGSWGSLLSFSFWRYFKTVTIWNLQVVHAITEPTFPSKGWGSLGPRQEGDPLHLQNRGCKRKFQTMRVHAHLRAEINLILWFVWYLMIFTSMNYSTRLFADEGRRTAEGKQLPDILSPRPFRTCCFPIEVSSQQQQQSACSLVSNYLYTFDVYIPWSQGPKRRVAAQQLSRK